MYNRVGRGEAPFKLDDEAQVFYSLINEVKKRDGLTVFAWCIMPNHYHLAVRTSTVPRLRTHDACIMLALGDGEDRDVATLQIRDMPVEVYEALALRARSERRSLAQQAVVELGRMPELQARQRRLALIAELRERLQRTPPVTPGTPLARLVREDRDR